MQCDVVVCPPYIGKKILPVDDEVTETDISCNDERYYGNKIGHIRHHFFTQTAFLSRYFVYSDVLFAPLKGKARNEFFLSLP